jgi:hypothetical protein
VLSSCNYSDYTFQSVSNVKIKKLLSTERGSKRLAKISEDSSAERRGDLATKMGPLQRGVPTMYFRSALPRRSFQCDSGLRLGRAVYSEGEPLLMVGHGGCASGGIEFHRVIASMSGLGFRSPWG